MLTPVYFAVFDLADGSIRRVGVTALRTVPHIAVAGEDVVTAGSALPSLTDDYVNLQTRLLEQRPALPDIPATRALSLNEDWVVPGVPHGTEVWIDGALAGMVDATGLALAFPLAAVWRLRLVPPFPTKPAECEVTVT